MSNHLRNLTVGGLAALAIAGTGAAVALGQDDPPSDTQPTQRTQQPAGDTSPADFERAARAALEEIGGDGVVESIERERRGYEVEIRPTDGSEIELRLDESFDVTATERDNEDDDGDDGDDGDDD